MRSESAMIGALVSHQAGYVVAVKDLYICKQIDGTIKVVHGEWSETFTNLREAVYKFLTKRKELKLGFD